MHDRVTTHADPSSCETSGLHSDRSPAWPRRQRLPRPGRQPVRSGRELADLLGPHQVDPSERRELIRERLPGLGVGKHGRSAAPRVTLERKCDEIPETEASGSTHRKGVLGREKPVVTRHRDRRTPHHRRAKHRRSHRPCGRGWHLLLEEDPDMRALPRARDLGKDTDASLSARGRVSPGIRPPVTIIEVAHEKMTMVVWKERV